MPARVVGPGDEEYESRRRVFNARIDRHPAAIVLCGTIDDIGNALAFAEERALPVVVRGGGMSDLSVLDGGVVLDVSPMAGVDVDATARRVRVGAGATWAQLDAATQEHGLAVTGGRVSTLGVAGVALGEGSGWLERALGPTSANLADAQLMLAGGSYAPTPDGPRELLRGLRGGDPGFGVVTELELELHPVGPHLLCGFLTFPRERAASVIARYRDVMRDAPPATLGGLSLFAGRGGACTIAFGYFGSIEEGERAVQPLRDLGPSLDAVTVNEYRAMQAMTDLQNPFGMRAHHREGVLGELSADAIDALVRAADLPAAALCRILLRPLGGATEYGGSDAAWAYDCLGLWPPVPELDAGNIAWVERLHEAMTPFGLEAAPFDAGV